MAKSKRSKVKMAYKAMRRHVLEPDHDEKLRAQAAKVYSAIGLPLPDERASGQGMAARNHGGAELVTTFHPTEEGPKLNIVHGPLAQASEKLRAPVPVVGLPIVGAGLEARMRSDHPQEEEEEVDGMDGSSEVREVTKGVMEERPYFYPKRARKGGSGVSKQRRQNTRHPKVRWRESFEIVATLVSVSFLTFFCYLFVFFASVEQGWRHL